MTKPIRTADGKFNGSIGDGKAKVPTAAPVNLHGYSSIENLETHQANTATYEAFRESRLTEELKGEALLEELRHLDEDTKGLARVVAAVDGISLYDTNLIPRMRRAITAAERELSEAPVDYVKTSEPTGPVKFPSDATLEGIAEAIMGQSSRVPDGYKVINSEEYMGDEHDSHRSVVIEDVATGRYYNFRFRYNYRMSDIEVANWQLAEDNQTIIDDMPVVEVFPKKVIKVEYSTSPSK